MLTSLRPAYYLLAFPIGSMGTVQVIFCLLSFFLYHDKQIGAFFVPGFFMLVCASLLLYKSRRYDFSNVSPRTALLFATLSWMVMGVLGAMPIIRITHVSFTDGVFESVSALTTAGGTILTGLDQMPRSFLMYRQFLQWMGGLGIVIFVVAVLPFLNVGGMKLLKAETPGPMKDEKLTPHIMHTARYLWFIYVGATILCAGGYSIAGMDLFDSIAHSFTTISTGGFSTHDASLGYYNSRAIEINADLFMLVGAIAFGMHFQFARSLNPRTYTRDEETRVFLLVVLFLSLLCATILYTHNVKSHVEDSLAQGVFHVISFITSTGYAADNFTAWPAQTGLLLVFAGYLGGCAGSTAGGNKIIRNIIAVKIIALQIKRVIHPSGIFIVRYNGRKVETPVLSATMAFLSFSITMSMFLTMAVMATGLDFWTSLTAISTCLNVLGPAFGELGNNFQPASDVATWIFSFTMILGRLEYFTVLVLFSVNFWRY